MFGTGVGIEENLVGGEYQFNCWNCGKRVKADTVIAMVDHIDAPEDEIKFEPLTVVNRPNPETPQENDFKYVDADDCGQYEILHSEGLREIYAASQNTTEPVDTDTQLIEVI